MLRGQSPFAMWSPPGLEFPTYEPLSPEEEAKEGIKRDFVRSAYMPPTMARSTCLDNRLRDHIVHTRSAGALFHKGRKVSFNSRVERFVYCDMDETETEDGIE